MTNVSAPPEERRQAGSREDSGTMFALFRIVLHPQKSAIAALFKSTNPTPETKNFPQPGFIPLCFVRTLSRITVQNTQRSEYETRLREVLGE